MSSVANNSCTDRSPKAEATSLKSKLSCGGKMQRLHAAASFETAPDRAVRSFTLVQAVPITADWSGKSLGRRRYKRKKEKLSRKKKGGRRRIVINPCQFLCDNMKQGGTGEWRPPAVGNMAYLTLVP